MRFKIDENLPLEFADILRSAHHDAATVGDEGLKGADDAAVMKVCLREWRVLVTLDLFSLMFVPIHRRHSRD